jgi:hypothetical protein
MLEKSDGKENYLKNIKYRPHVTISMLDKTCLYNLYMPACKITMLTCKKNNADKQLFHVNMLLIYVDTQLYFVHINIFISHVDINKLHIDISELHVNISCMFT